MGRLFTLIIIFILSSKFTIAQENIIDHPIKKGESVYVISKKYGVSMNAIFQLNPGSEDVIYAGRTLKIPMPNSSNSNTVTSENKITNYEVKRGETKSGLSKRFGVSIAMLEQQNPHIIRMLQAGHIINVDKTIREEERVNEGEHRVVKGETLWGISRRYGVSVEQLTDVNASQLSEFLQIGQVLTIPDKNNVYQNPGEYLVKRGDTKFELAKRFNMTIDQLEEQNPHIIDMLMAGHLIDIEKPINNNEDTLAEVEANENSTDQPLTENNRDEDGLNSADVVAETTDSNTTKVDSTNTQYVDYIIKPKETLFSLSRKADMTIDQLTTLNPKLSTAVNAGDIIKMPREATSDSVVTNDNSESTKEDVVASTNTETNKNDALYSSLNIDKANGLYFYTPFSSEELRSSELREEMVNSNSDYQRFIDFFQGAQIAIDSAKALNLNFEITLIKNNNLKQGLNIESDYEKNAVLVPFLENGNNYPEIISNQSLSIIDIESNINSAGNNTLLKAMPPYDIQKRKTLDYISNQDAQVIVVSDLEEAQNKGLIQQAIPNAKFLKVDNAGFFETNALQDALDSNKLNYVILDSEKTIVFLNTTTALMNQLADYDIQLVLMETSLLPKQNEVSKMRYRILKLIFPSIMYPEINNAKTDFEITYRDIYDVAPTRSAVLGFNVTLDILLRISQNTSFENTFETITSEHSHLKFEYKKTNKNIYSNTSLYLMQYDSNEGITVLKNR
ncbi:muramidase family protein [Winogradskyella flava]|uniref:LysM peptidoglycan-binding domain-containing protein n=1 Tax=Winogradskyella flava TaxID=1884876 RepID=A0A842ISG7_9FLAO|nr:LysM peptidoglycan-binding domain-containing protein [Winogradskyella flava]MBC2844756.1 LysM peptidoglycan-binding domain-containing protein [Winogradskyella flava]